MDAAAVCDTCYRETCCSEECYAAAEEWHPRECIDGGFEEEEASLADRYEIFKVSLEQCSVDMSDCLPIFVAIRSLAHPRLASLLRQQYVAPKGLSERLDLHDVRYAQFNRVMHVLGLPVEMRGKPPHDFAWFKDLWCKVNSHYVDATTSQGHEVCALLEFGMFFNHSCRPNVVHHAAVSPSQIIFVAKEDIPAGAELCICYAGEPSDTREGRRKYLKATYGFDCACPECILDRPL
eukprot:TRINITY_DN7571_c0_g2_i3.p1 TRINITY_DN7571_c0_g2~~TRINITY_DN7571_c0_g2_i3.p1  ORF type:complete len:261 (+),score=82.48 TRINITY_DN7571_c0_g2_i3:76-783(+)